MDAYELYDELVELNQRLRNAYERLAPLSGRDPRVNQYRKALQTPGRQVPNVLALIREGQLEQAGETMPDVFGVNNLLIQADQLITELEQPEQRVDHYEEADYSVEPTYHVEQLSDGSTLAARLAEEGLTEDDLVSAARKARKLDNWSAPRRRPSKNNHTNRDD